MANSAVSESWLLKYLGDTHWQLLSLGFGKKSSEFKDSSNNRLYATFLRIFYELNPLNNFQENEILNFKSKIEGFGKSSFLTSIKCSSSRNSISSSILTTFSVKSNDNILKSCESIDQNIIVSLLDIPKFVNEYRLLKKNLLEEHCSGGWRFEVGSNSVFDCEYIINPYYDINGVGLLYFAAYPLISDICLAKYLPETTSFNTIFRDVFYFANCKPSEIIDFSLINIRKEGENILTCSHLYRKSDRKLLSKVFTVKRM